MVIRKLTIAYAAAATLGIGFLSGCTSDPARHGPPTGGEMVTDAIAVRPLTLTYTAVGLGAWVLTLPFTLPSGSAGDAGEAWVLGPLQYTFARPLGEMSPRPQE